MVSCFLDRQLVSTETIFVIAQQDSCTHPPQTRIFAGSSEEHSSRRGEVGEEVGSYSCSLTDPVSAGGVHVGGVRFGNVRVDLLVGVPKV